MKTIRTLSLFLALTGAATTAFAQQKAPEKKEAPAKPEPPKSDAPKSDARPEMSAEEAAKVEKFFNEIVDGMVKNKDSCPKMAAHINATFDKHQDWLKKISESEKDLPKASKDKLKKREGEVMGAFEKCKDDKDVTAAMGRFLSLGSKRKAAVDSKATEGGGKPAPAAPANPPAKK